MRGSFSRLHLGFSQVLLTIFDQEFYSNLKDFAIKYLHEKIIETPGQFSLMVLCFNNVGCMMNIGLKHDYYLQEYNLENFKFT